MTPLFSTVGGVVQVILFFLGLWGERNSVEAKKKAEIAKEMIDAFAETDKKKQASRLNAVVGGINRM